MGRTLSFIYLFASHIIYTNSNCLDTLTSDLFKLVYQKQWCQLSLKNYKSATFNWIILDIALKLILLFLTTG